jgi:hypothetical protein
MTRKLAALAAVALLTACGDDEAGSPSAGERPVTPTSSTSVPAATTTPAPPAATTTPVSTPAVQPPPVSSKVCTVRDLGVSVGASEGTAGTVYRALVFTNTGGRTCTIQGFPGVSFVAGADGHQVGEAAQRVGEKGPAVTLKPGGTATSPVGFVSIGVFDPETCQATPVRGLRVYPPQERKSEFVPYETTACAGEVPVSQLTVRTVHEGSGLE